MFIVFRLYITIEYFQQSNTSIYYTISVSYTYLKMALHFGQFSILKFY